MDTKFRQSGQNLPRSVQRRLTMAPVAGRIGLEVPPIGCYRSSEYASSDFLRVRFFDPPFRFYHYSLGSEYVGRVDRSNSENRSLQAGYDEFTVRFSGRLGLAIRTKAVGVWYTKMQVVVAWVNLETDGLLSFQWKSVIIAALDRATMS